MRRALLPLVAILLVSVAWSGSVVAQEQEPQVYLPLTLNDAGPVLGKPVVSAPATQRPQATYTPLPTYTALPTYTPQPTFTLPPAATPTDAGPTPTPTVTLTPRPKVECGNIVVDGGFEADDHSPPWSIIGSGVGVIEPDDESSLSPKSGKKMASILADTGGDLSILTHEAWPAIPEAELVSATLIFYVFGITVERLPARDSLLVAALASPLSQCRDECSKALEFLTNDDADGRWVRYQVDVKDVMSTMRWRNIELNFAGKNDISDDTGWLIDDVSLSVCRRVPAGDGGSAQPRADVVSGAPSWRRDALEKLIP